MSIQDNLKKIYKMAMESDTVRQALEDAERESVDGILTEVRDAWIPLNEAVRGMFGGYTVDEMALVSPDHHKLARWVRRFAARDGYELFNAAQDKVVTSPITASYEVEYWFMRTPFDYRLELMSVVGGFSPLHSAATNLNDSGLYKVHASFKCQSQEAYASAVSTLLRNDWEPALKCQSTYGRFSYFSHPDLSGWYLKPRVNLRDGERDA